MPIYEYTCKKCTNSFELLIRGSERAACPECGGARLEKHFSVPAAHTGAAAGQLPICGADAGPPCGAGYCRTGQCDFD